MCAYAGSQNMPSPSTSLQQKTDEAESRETSPDYSEAEVQEAESEVQGAESEVPRAESEIPRTESESLADRFVEIEPESATNSQEVQEIHYEREPDLPEQPIQYRREVASPKKHKKKSG